LSLVRCGIGEHGARALAEALVYNERVDSIDLDGAFFGRAGKPNVIGRETMALLRTLLALAPAARRDVWERESPRLLPIVQ